MLEMTSDASTNAGKHVILTIACAHSQRYTKDSVFSLAKNDFVHLTLRNFPPFVEPNSNVNSDGPTNRLSIRQF